MGKRTSKAHDVSAALTLHLLYVRVICIFRPINHHSAFLRAYIHSAFHSPHSITYLHDAVHVKGMVAPTPNRRAVVPGNVAIRTAGLKCRVTNATALVIYIPPPGGHAMPSMSVYEGMVGNGEGEVSRVGQRKALTHISMAYAIFSKSSPQVPPSTGPPNTYLLILTFMRQNCVRMMDEENKGVRPPSLVSSQRTVSDCIMRWSSLCMISVPCMPSKVGACMRCEGAK